MGWAGMGRAADTPTDCSLTKPAGRRHMVTHRFSDFHRLGKSLMDKSRASKQRELPPKTWCVPQSVDFYERRMHMLQLFLDELLSAPGVGLDAELRDFLELGRFDAFPSEFQRGVALLRDLERLRARGVVSEAEAHNVRGLVVCGDAGKFAGAEKTLAALFS